MEKSLRAVNFGHFLRWRQEEMSLTVGAFAERAGYSERQMLSIQKNYPTAARIQSSKLAEIARAAGYAGRDELDVAWRSTPVPTPDFRKSKGDGRINLKARVATTTRTAIAQRAARDSRTVEEVAGDVLDGAFSATRQSEPSAAERSEPQSDSIDVVDESPEGKRQVVRVRVGHPERREPSAEQRAASARRAANKNRKAESRRQRKHV